MDKAIARTGKPVPNKYWEFADLEKEGVHEQCAYCMKRECGMNDNWEERSGSDMGERWVCSMMMC